MSAENCKHIIFSNDFSSSSSWTMVGDGSVNVSSGVCNFVNASGGAINKVSRSIGATLSNTYWKAECKFSITSANASGHGVGAVVIALTAGSLDFMNDLSAETNQDGVGVVLFSDSPYDEDINNWKFLIENKKGNVRTVSTSFIYANSAITDYYIRIERTSSGITQLSIFSDAAFSSHITGSPYTFAVDPTVTGLNTVQHGATTPGYPPRLINATVDNDIICDDSDDSCSNIILNDDFSSSSTWTMVGDGSVIVSSGVCNYINASGGAINKVSKNLSTSLSDNYWKAECKFSITSANASGHGVGAVVMALTAGSLDFMNDLSAETNQDGIGVVLFSDSPYDEDINNWKFLMENKKGNVRTVSASFIYANSTITDYYIRLERSSSGITQLSIFSDAAFSSHITGSPYTFAADPSITGLNTIQHGVATPGYPPRLINATVDNDFICQESSAGISDFTETNHLMIFPNPSENLINLRLDEIALSPSKYIIYDVWGNMVRSNYTNGNEQLDISELKNGTYFIKVENKDCFYWGKFLKIQ